MFRTEELLARQQISVDLPLTLLDLLLQTFTDLRENNAAASSDDNRLESALSTAEQIGVLEDALLHAGYFGDQKLSGDILAQSLISTLVRRLPEDSAVMNKFWHEVVAGHSKRFGREWSDFLAGGQQAMKKLKS